MTEQVRNGLVAKAPEVSLSGKVEVDEVYVVAGHKGQPAAVAKRGGRPTPPSSRRQPVDPCNICGPRVIAERARAVDSAAIRAIVVRWLAPSEVWMPHYVGLDVSQKTTSICVVDEQGRRLWRGVCTTHPDPIATRVLRHAGEDAKIGIETGSMTPWLVHGLRAAGPTEKKRLAYARPASFWLLPTSIITPAIIG